MSAALNATDERDAAVIAAATGVTVTVPDMVLVAATDLGMVTALVMDTVVVADLGVKFPSLGWKCLFKLIK